MSLRIDAIQSQRDLDSFLGLPERLYRRDACWVAPLKTAQKKIFDKQKNPFFSHGEIIPIVARRDNRVVGRIAAIRNTAHESFQGEAVGFFGFFECENDPEAASALVRAAAEWCGKWGLPRMRGPVNPDTNAECGLLVDGFDELPMIMMPYGRSYYDSLLSSSGLGKAKDLVAYIAEDRRAVERLERGASVIARRYPDVTLHQFDVRRLDDEVDRFRRVYNRSWERNWGFVPMTDEEVDHMARELKPAIDPRLVVFAERGGEPVGVALALPDLNQALKHAKGRMYPFGWIPVLWHARRIKQIRVLALGLVPEVKGRGIDMLLYNALCRGWIEGGYNRAELSWVLEDNAAMCNALERMGCRRYKTYRIYEAAVDGTAR